MSTASTMDTARSVRTVGWSPAHRAPALRPPNSTTALYRVAMRALLWSSGTVGQVGPAADLGSGRQLVDPRTGLPVVAMVGGGQLAGMPTRPRSPSGSRCGCWPPIRTSRPRWSPPTSSSATTATSPRCAARRGRHRPDLRPRARADRAPAGAGGRRVTGSRPGPAALVHAQDKLVLRRALAEAGEPQPAWAEVTDGGRGRRLRRRRRLAGACSRRPRVATTARACFVVDGPDAGGRPPRAARHPAGRGAGRDAARAVRAGRALAVRAGARSGRWWRPCSGTASAPRCSRPRPGWTTNWPPQAQELAIRIADRLGVVGMLAVELFETADGRRWSTSWRCGRTTPGTGRSRASRTSQFEQHLRAVLDYPLGVTAMTAPVVVMANVLGGGGGRRWAARTSASTT